MEGRKTLYFVRGERRVRKERRTVEEVKYTGSWRNEIFVGEVKFIVVELKSTL